MSETTVHVLLVEDDDVDAEVVTRSFNSLRITNPITIARNGIEAIKMLRGEDGYQRVPRPYVILLDINMPQMNGLEFLKVIRQDSELERSVVFVLTTSDNDEDMRDAYTEHVAGYILKQRAGDAMLDVPTMIQRYWRLVEFPPDR